jgi:hypothetical protein
MSIIRTIGNTVNNFCGGLVRSSGNTVKVSECHCCIQKDENGPCVLCGLSLR